MLTTTGAFTQTDGRTSHCVEEVTEGVRLSIVAYASPVPAPVKVSPRPSCSEGERASQPAEHAFAAPGASRTRPELTGSHRSRVAISPNILGCPP